MIQKYRSHLTLTVFLVVFAVLGVYFLWPSHAASPNPSGIIFNGDFETPSSHNPVNPWYTANGQNSVQCQNYGAPTSTAHYPGDFYFDNGTSASVVSPGSLYNVGSSATVPPGAGAYSGRIVLPTTPTGHARTYCAINGLTTAVPGDLGTDKYYGMMIYVPSGETLHNSDFSGDNIWEFHFNAVWGAPLAWEIHTSGTSGTNGSSDSVVLAVETGACNSSATSNAGCQYRSQAGHTQCNLPPDPNIGTIHCLPGNFAIPPGQLKYGVWNEIVMHVHWASDATGSVQTWYKTTNSSSWIASANVSGLPTVQWDVTKGCCGFPVVEDSEQYTAAVSQPFSLNIDNQIIGTNLAAVQALMPTGTAPGTPPTNSNGSSTPSPQSTQANQPTSPQSAQGQTAQKTSANQGQEATKTSINPPTKLTPQPNPRVSKSLDQTSTIKAIIGGTLLALCFAGIVAWLLLRHRLSRFAYKFLHHPEPEAPLASPLPGQPGEIIRPTDVKRQ